MPSRRNSTYPSPPIFTYTWNIYTRQANRNPPTGRLRPYPCRPWSGRHAGRPARPQTGHAEEGRPVRQAGRGRGRRPWPAVAWGGRGGWQFGNYCVIAVPRGGGTKICSGGRGEGGHPHHIFPISCSPFHKPAPLLSPLPSLSPRRHNALHSFTFAVRPTPICHFRPAPLQVARDGQ